MVRLINKNFFSIVARHIFEYPTPSNINYFWGLGSISGLLLVLQVLSGAFLAIYYESESTKAFESVQNIMDNVLLGWLIRYCHSCGASLFFMSVYVHIARNLYFRSYRKALLWNTGLLFFFLMMATAFVGYVLPWGQMSLWGATVITSLFGVVPYVGEDFVRWIWGGFGVENPTLKRFYVLHFLVPLVLIALAFLHIVVLHKHGSTNPVGTPSKTDTTRFYPKFVVKDIFCFTFLVGFLVVFAMFWFPNVLGHPDNYLKADPLVTPKHIVPEWYFLPFYAILRAVPNKDFGVCLMFAAIAVLFFLPYIAKFECKSSKFTKTSQFFFWSFVLNFLILGYLGSCEIEQPYTTYSQFAAFWYFLQFVIFLPALARIEKIY